MSWTIKLINWLSMQNFQIRIKKTNLSWLGLHIDKDHIGFARKEVGTLNKF